MLLILALVPQNPGIHETVLLFAIPRNAYQAVYFALASWVVGIAAPAAGSFPDYDAFANVMRSILLVTMYWPALAMVLSRPNAGVLPGWLERLLIKCPVWLRGTSTSALAASKSES